MKTAKTDKGEFLFVEVSKGAKDVHLDGSYVWYSLDWKYHTQYSESLPPGNYQFITTTQTATEKEAKIIIEDAWFNWKYKDYQNDRFVFYTALESLQSLTESIGDTGNCAILKVIK